MINRKDYLLAVKRLIFHADTRNDIALVLDYLAEKEIRAFDKAIDTNKMLSIQGVRRGYQNVRDVMSMTPTELDVEMQKEKDK